jgi:hypothetical protein
MTAVAQETLPGPWGFDNGYQLRVLATRATGKFDVTEIIQPDAHFVIKTSDNASAQADLGNSVAWTKWIESQRPHSFHVPHTIAELSATENGQLATPMAHITWVDGAQPKEDELIGVVPRYVDVIQELAAIQVEWAGDAAAWTRQKLHTAGSIVLSHIANKLLVVGLEDVIDSDAFDCIKAGVVHGDLAPKNTIIDKTGKLWLLDAEFGTHGYRPEFAVPRTRDAAYLLHLLHCQYQQPEAGETLLSELISRFGDDNTWEQEFWLATLERTLTMFRLFVVNRPDGPTIDQRRLNPAPYLHLLRTSIEHLDI